MHYLTDPLQFEFMRRALVAIVLTGVVSGVLGTYVVLRGLAFIGDALTHAVFPGIVIAVAAGRSILLGALVVGTATALGIATISRNRRVSEDTAIGILFAAMFALGVVLVSTLATYQRDVADLSGRCLTCHTLQSCGLFPTHGKELAGRCVDCHMPLQKSNLIVSALGSEEEHVEVRSHWIRVYEDSLTRK